jgi:hypothetical protein
MVVVIGDDVCLFHIKHMQKRGIEILMNTVATKSSMGMGTHHT